MSEENVERLRPVYARFEKGNFDVDAELLTPDVTWELVNPDGRSTASGDRISAFFRDFLAQWEDFRITAEQFVEAGDSVLVVERQRGVGKASGVPTKMTAYSVWTFRDGHVVKVRWEIDREKAFEAAGLSE